MTHQTPISPDLWRAWVASGRPHGKQFATQQSITDGAARGAIKLAMSQALAKRERRARSRPRVPLPIHWRLDRWKRSSHERAAAARFWARTDHTTWRADAKARVKGLLMVCADAARREAARATLEAACRAMRSAGWVQTHTSGGSGRATSRYFVRRAPGGAHLPGEVRLSDHELPDNGRPRKARLADLHVEWLSKVTDILADVAEAVAAEGPES